MFHWVVTYTLGAALKVVFRPGREGGRTCQLSGQEYVEIYAKQAKDELQDPAAESDLP